MTPYIVASIVLAAIIFLCVVTVTSAFVEYAIYKTRLHTPNELDASIDFVYQPKKQIQLLMMLKYFHSICNTHDIQYWLCGGSLLGAVRHNGFILNDDDVDVCIQVKDVDKLFSISHDTVTLEWYGADQCLLKMKSKKNPSIFIDIFITEHDENVYRYKGSCCQTFHEMWYDNELFPLRTVKFCGINVRVPNRSSSYLRRTYGNNWAKEWRISHYHFNKASIVFSKIRNFFRPEPKLVLTPQINAMIIQMNEHIANFNVGQL